ncbi:MAG: hypothetical protein JWM90_149, partial [Thermoleophilia bacterium]|nr:hypothetical protein [Thermoleophilia bacterium]
AAAEATVLAPRMKTRAAWSASAPRWTPDIADAALGVVVHHTATTNSYACSQVPAIMRSIQRSHMGGNGWNDIGYNYLIDRCGVIWEGRAGGLTKAVIGAHASGFNTSTVGVSLIGTFASVRPTAAARAALQRLIAWRMDVAHIAPTGKMALTARTSDKFALGSRVVARAVSGHRDLFPSACPGAVTYRDLNAFARAAWPLGGIKVANVTRGFVLADPATGAVGSVTMRAVANQRDGQLRIRLQRRSDGAVLHDVSLVGNVIATTWRPAEGAAPIPVWDLRMRIDATSATGQVARPVDESLGYWNAAPGFEVATPPAASVHPGGVDTSNDQLRLSYTLQQPARVGAWFYDPAAGTWVATSVSSAQQDPTGGIPRELVISVPDELPDGTWELRVGNEDDRAPARSMRRYAVTVAREA